MSVSRSIAENVQEKSERSCHTRKEGSDQILFRVMTKMTQKSKLNRFSQTYLMWIKAHQIC